MYTPLYFLKYFVGSAVAIRSLFFFAFKNDFKSVFKIESEVIRNAIYA
jgi:hypothetical protein